MTTPDQIEAIAVALETSAKLFCIAATNLAKACSRALDVTTEAHGMLVFAESATREVAIAATVVAEVLRNERENAIN
jgi:hypothetical protein